MEFGFICALVFVGAGTAFAAAECDVGVAVGLVVLLEEVAEVAAATWLCVAELGATEADVVLDDMELTAEVDDETA